MTTHNAPDLPPGESGADRSGAPEPPRAARSRASAILTKPWFWILLLGTLWVLPLLKSLGVEYPDPVPGHDRVAEEFELQEEQGATVTRADLRGHILVIHSLDLDSTDSAEADLTRLREWKKRLRGLGSLVMNVVLVRNSEGDTLARFLTEKKARKPNNLYLLDEGGRVLEVLRTHAQAPEARLLVLDRHGRLRGAYGSTEAEGNRLAQELGSLANWLGSDPEIGAPVYR